MHSISSSTIYQVYPRSFFDASGDGIGDLPGITAKLPYIKSLGVDIIWINPFYPSPQNDNGYDITNYKAVDPLFGTMTDFEELVDETKKLGIGIMIDLVFNHTSTEHPWFQKALAGDDFYRDFYYFKKGKENGEPPTNWLSKFGGSAWEKIAHSDEFYLHLYDVTQADLNWENPHVRKEIYDIVRFWMKKGVAGFRLDVLNVISKPHQFEDDADGDGRKFYTDGPNIHHYLKELRQETFGGTPIITVGEMSSTTIKNAIQYSNPSEHELSMVFHFHHLKVDYKSGQKWQIEAMRFDELRHLFHLWQTEMASGRGWDALFWNNHDQPRALGRFTSNAPKYHYYAATMLAATIHLMRGTPYIYMGEEIGMTNPYYDQIEAYQDVETINHYQILQNQGLSERETMEIIKLRSRDNSRIPMQWNDSCYAGFSNVSPVYPLSANKNHINVAQALSNPDSIFYFYKKLIALRKKYCVIQTGDYSPVYTSEDLVLAYIRENDDCRLLAVHYYGEKNKRLTLAKEFTSGQILLSNYGRKTVESELDLNAYETLAILINKN